MEVDGVMSKALRGFITFPTATLEGFPHTDLRPVPIFGMVLYTVHILKKREGRRKKKIEIVKEGSRNKEAFPFFSVVSTLCKTNFGLGGGYMRFKACKITVITRYLKFT